MFHFQHVIAEAYDTQWEVEVQKWSRRNLPYISCKFNNVDTPMYFMFQAHQVFVAMDTLLSWLLGISTKACITHCITNVSTTKPQCLS